MKRKIHLPVFFFQTDDVVLLSNYTPSEAISKKHTKWPFFMKKNLNLHYCKNTLIKESQAIS